MFYFFYKRKALIKRINNCNAINLINNNKIKIKFLIIYFINASILVKIFVIINIFLILISILTRINFIFFIFIKFFNNIKNYFFANKYQY